MYARVTLVRSDPSKLEAAIANFKETVAPASRKAPGYAGSFLLVNRESGEGAGGTYWDSIEAMNATEQIGQENRRQSAESIGTEILDVDRFEIFLADRKTAPTTPAFLRQTQIYADPAKIQDAIDFVRSSVLAQVASHDGYRTLIGGVNRMTGRLFVTSGWESAAARSASNESLSRQRQEAARVAGAESVRVDEWELAFIEIMPPARDTELVGVGREAAGNRPGRPGGLEKVVALFPVLPGKDARGVAAIFEGRLDEYAEARRRQGIHMERAYEQVTPMGTFVIAYLESERPFGETTAAIAQSDLPIDRDFIRGIKDVHGFDATQPPPGEPPELLADWMDETRTARGRGLAFCAPVMPGATEKGRAFAHEAYEARRDELAASRRAQGVTREVVTLNHTPMGDVVCVYVEGDDPVQGNKQFAESRSEFDVWFKDRCKEIFPPEVDFNEPLPAIAEIFDSQEVLVAR
jgi:hypothetical protein